MRKLVHVLFDERLELEEHAGAALRVEARPLGESLRCALHGASHLLTARERNARLNLARGRIEDVAEAAGGAAHMPSADEMRELPDDTPPFVWNPTLWDGGLIAVALKLGNLAFEWRHFFS